MGLSSPEAPDGDRSGRAQTLCLRVVGGGTVVNVSLAVPRSSLTRKPMVRAILLERTSRPWGARKA